MIYLKCNIWCYKEGNENLGQPEEDMWLPLVFDLEAVYAIKSNGEGNEFTGSNKAVIYLGGEHLVTDLDFDELTNQWLYHKPKRV